MGNTVGRLQSLFSPHQFDVIIGSLLGDGRLECRSVGKRYPISARLRIHQSDKQKEYVFWKYKQLAKFVLRKPRRIKASYDSKRKRTHYSWYFHTKSTKELGKLYHCFYKNGQKVLPKDIFHVLSLKGLAIWFMDDGSNTGNSYTLSTHCFSVSEQKRIIDFLKRKYDIAATLIRDRTKHKIAIGRKEYQKLNTLIESFIIPSMNYKICNPRNDFSVRDTQ